MAALTDQQRFEVWAEFMRRSDLGTFGALTKLELRAALDALDTFFVDNASTINSAIPQPARAQLTISQKAILLMMVVAKRYLVGA